MKLDLNQIILESTPVDDSFLILKGRKVSFSRTDVLLKPLIDDISSIKLDLMEMQSQLHILQQYDLITKMNNLIKSSNKAIYYVALSTMIENSNIEGEDLPNDFDDIILWIKTEQGDMPKSFEKWISLVKGNLIESISENAVENTNEGGNQ